MRQLDFFIRKKDFASLNRLINKYKIKRLWYFWGTAELVYFQVSGNNKNMASFSEESQHLRRITAKEKLW